MNKYDSALFKVDQRSVSERFGILKARVESKNREELGATGIVPDITAIDQAMEDIIERIKEYEKQHEEEDSSKIEKNDKEKEAPADMRLKALKTFSESKISGKLLQAMVFLKRRNPQKLWYRYTYIPQRKRRNKKYC